MGTIRGGYGMGSSATAMLGEQRLPRMRKSPNKVIL